MESVTVALAIIAFFSGLAYYKLGKAVAEKERLEQKEQSSK